MRTWLLVGAAVSGAALLAGCSSSGATTHDATWQAGYRYAVANQKQAESDAMLGVNGLGGDPDQSWCMVATPPDMPQTTPGWIAGCVAGLQATIGEPTPAGQGRP